MFFLLVGDQLDSQFFYIIRLFQSSTWFEQTRAHHQEVSCINTASGIVTLKTSGWSKITKIQFSCIVYKTFIGKVKTLVKSFKV